MTQRAFIKPLLGLHLAHKYMKGGRDLCISKSCYVQSDFRYQKTCCIWARDVGHD